MKSEGKMIQFRQGDGRESGDVGGGTEDNDGQRVGELWSTPS